MQPIYIEVSDEITTVIERLQATPEQAVALVVPKGAAILQSVVNLKLTKKAAADTGKTLVLITTDKIGRNLASQVGLPVASHLEEAASTEPEVPDEAKVIAGVKIHRYYEDNEKAEDSEEQLPEPIIPKQILETAPVQEEVSPIKVRSIALAEPLIPVTPSVVEVITPTQEASASTPERPAAAVTESTTDPITVEQPTLPATAVAAAAPLATKATPLQPRRNRRFIFFALYLLLLLLLGAGGASAFYFPATKVHITVQGQAWNKSLPVTVTINNQGGTQAVAATLLSSEADNSVTIKATGTKDIGTTASGNATLVNKADSHTQTVPAGSSISINGQTFVTTADASVPGANVSNGNIIPGTATVAVTAANDGEGGNVSNGSGAVTASSGTILQVQNLTTSGGTSKVVAVVTQNDIANGKAAVTKNLQTDTLSKIQDQLKAHPYLYKDGSQVFTAGTITTSVTADTQADSVQVSGSGTTKLLVVDRSQLQSALPDWVKDSIPANSTLQITDIQATDFTLTDQNSATFTAVATGKTTPLVNTAKLKSDLIGKSRSAGEAVLTQEAPGAQVTIEQKPTWWPIHNFPYSGKYLQVTSE